MRCKRCGWVSKFPVCTECATAEEKHILEKLKKIPNQIRSNNVELLKRYLKFPALSPMVYIGVLSIIIFVSLALFLAIYIINPIILLFIGTFCPLVLFVVIGFAFGNVPEENVTNGLEAIDLKYQNIVLSRRKKKYLALLSKQYNEWSMDEKIETRFHSYEGTLGDIV